MTAQPSERAWVDFEHFEWIEATPGRALLRLSGLCALPADETDAHARLIVEHEAADGGFEELRLVQGFTLDRSEPGLGESGDLVLGRWSCAFSASCELVQLAAAYFVFELDGWTRIALPAPVERRLRPAAASRQSPAAAARRTIGPRLGRGALGILTGALIGLLAWLAVDLIGGSPPRPTSAAADRAAQSVISLEGAGGVTAVRNSPLTRGGSLVARATIARVPVYRSPVATAPDRALSNPNKDGVPLVLLVVGAEHRGRLEVMLPTRPNLSRGWIPRKDVRLAFDRYRLIVRLARHLMTVWRGGRVLERIPVGVGRRAVTPTPFGLYYITELLRQPDPGGDYGPYAFGLSAHSPVLHEFAGGNGEIGLHGTNQPWTIGHDVSHGCIRVYNSVITRLAGQLPLGTPVMIEN